MTEEMRTNHACQITSLQCSAAQFTNTYMTQRLDSPSRLLSRLLSPLTCFQHLHQLQQDVRLLQRGHVQGGVAVEHHLLEDLGGPRLGAIVPAHSAGATVQCMTGQGAGGSAVISAESRH